MKRPSIPSAIKREVRQRCGFGCVICGDPIYEYDHILGWAKTKRHLPEELTLLCKKHHGEKTAGRLPNDLVIRCNKNPKNVSSGLTEKHELFYHGDKSEFVVGSNILLADFSLMETSTSVITIYGYSLLNFRYEDDFLLLSAHFKDENDNSMLIIQYNELLLSATSWDIVITGRKLEIRKNLQTTLLRLRFEIPNSVVIEKAYFNHEGHSFEINKGKFYYDKQMCEHSGMMLGNIATNFRHFILVTDKNSDYGSAAIKINASR